MVILLLNKMNHNEGKSERSSMSSNTPTTARSSSTQLAIKANLKSMKDNHFRDGSQKTMILTEEKYYEKIGDIIERDFFPDMKIYREMDQEEIKRANLSKVNDSPLTFETPNPRASATSLPDKPSQHSKTSKDSNLSLDQFFSNHKCENDVTFNEMIKESIEKEKAKKPWMYKEDPLDKEKQLAVPPIADQFQEFKRPFEVDTWAYKPTNALLFHPEGVPPENNQLDIEKRLKIVHANTSLKEIPYNERQSQTQIQKMAYHQARHLEGKIGVDGKVVTIQSQTPKYMSTPSPRPGVAESPLMTYGQLDSTPMRIEPSTPAIHAGHGFSMQPVSKRERLADELERAASNRKSASSKTPNIPRYMQSPLFSPRNSIFDKRAVTPSGRRISLRDIVKRHRTGSPSVTPSPSRLMLSQLVKSSSSKVKNDAGSHSFDERSEKDLTDDLLKLPLKPRTSLS